MHCAAPRPGAPPSLAQSFGHVVSNSVKVILAIDGSPEGLWHRWQQNILEIVQQQILVTVPHTTLVMMPRETLVMMPVPRLEVRP
jgi:hypothetical protein